MNIIYFLRHSVIFCLSLFSIITFAQDKPTLNTLLQVYKSPQCGCCAKWVDHIEQAGFTTQVINTNSLAEIKTQFAIAPNHRSCHTAVSQQGYVFEGHIPAKVIKRFLQEQPKNAVGLSVAGMPVGSPGMEVKNNFMPYQVVMLLKDGSTKTYAQINSAKQQH
ncbi:DUF411 domain-containing protein [Spartinivicinus ruber]|uniref:DUF411 domain-containing protein n=1 Tax=Spartinivicinus ruber TaxID=2683272 RepID=UPI0013D82E4F|nr:DUF411 domain-containing protein [Spartinivicinus ruber]